MGSHTESEIKKEITGVEIEKRGAHTRERESVCMCVSVKRVIHWLPPFQVYQNKPSFALPYISESSHWCVLE